MSYIDGFVIPVPTANKDKFVRHATTGDGVFIDFGATRVVECWGEDVPKGKTTDFQGAVAAKDDETIVFSWIEWPDKATRDAGMGKMMAPDFKDPRMDPDKNPMPFDGPRLIFGGFEPIVEHGASEGAGYAQGFAIPVPEANREAYRKAAEECWAVLKDYGALRVIEAWGDDVPNGKQTDFYRAVKAEAGEKVVFSFVEWPSREVCDAAKPKMEADQRMQPGPDFEMPFDGKRLIYGGFAPIVELEK